MRKIHLEVIGAILFVFLSSLFIYGKLAGFDKFWNAQFFWSILLFLGWAVISTGYYHQGFKVHKAGDASEVSLYLPISVFIVQCILFIKGIYYHDWALTVGAVMVNSGVLFCLYQIFRATKRTNK